MRILEGQHGLAEALHRRLMGDALLHEAMRPVADGAFRHAEHGLLGLADAEPARRHMVPREEGEDGAGRAGLIAIIEVIGAGIVEIDGLLHQPQAEGLGVELDIAARIAGNRGDVVDAMVVHDSALRCGRLERPVWPFK